MFNAILGKLKKKKNKNIYASSLCIALEFYFMTQTAIPKRATYICKLGWIMAGDVIA